jgi:hypothetical protein
VNFRPRLSPVAAPALLGAAFLFVASSAAADTVAVVSRGGEGIVQTARESLRAAVTAQGHRQPSVEAVTRAVGKVADGVVDTRAEYKIVGDPLGADWVITGRFTPFGASSRPGYRAEVEAYQAKTGRVESLDRDVDARVADAQLGEMLRYLLRPEGVGHGGITFRVLPPPDAPVETPKDPPKPKETPKELPKEPPKPSEVKVTAPPVERVSSIIPYGSNAPFTVGGHLLLSGALTRPAGARGSSFAGTLVFTGGYLVAPDDVPGLELRADIGIGILGLKAFHGLAGGRWVFPLADDSFISPEVGVGLFRPFGGDQSARFLAKGAAVFVQRLAPETQLEATVDLLAAPGGTGTLLLGGASVGGSFRF